MNLPQQNIVTTVKTNLMQTVSVANNSTMPLSNAMDPLLELYENLQSSEVRMGVNEADGKPFVSVYDFINFITGRDRTNGYAQVTFHNMSKYSNEFKSLTFWHRIGKKDTPCINITGIFQLISILGNKISAKYRSWATQLQHDNFVCYVHNNLPASITKSKFLMYNLTQSFFFNLYLEILHALCALKSHLFFLKQHRKLYSYFLTNCMFPITKQNLNF